jgi:hypothetical protein
VTPAPPAPPLTGTWPVFDVVEIAQEAAERAGIDFRAGYALTTARRSLELLSIEWANRGLNLWTIEGPIIIDLTPGVEKYALPDDTVDLIEHVIRQYQSSTGNTYTDLPVDRMTVSEYAAIPNKLASGRPTIIHIRRNIKPCVYVWMVPPASPVYQLVTWRLRRMRSVGAGGTGVPEIPWRFVPALIAGLAFYLALKSKDPNVAQRIPALKEAYEEQFTLASDEDRDRASFRFVPGGYQWI